MNAAKLARMESGLNGMARKVLEAVPIKEPWTKEQIYGELRRAGATVDRAVVEGCFATLGDRGLVKESPRGSYIRIAAREPQPTITEEIPMSSTIRPIITAAPPAAAPATDTLSRLANLGSLLRRAADEVDALALDVEARVQEAGKGSDKLRQLQALLKEINA